MVSGAKKIAPRNPAAQARNAIFTLRYNSGVMKDLWMRSERARSKDSHVIAALICAPSLESNLASNDQR
jgi:hypothetical protein